MSKEKITVFTPGTHAGKRYNPGPEGIALEVSPSQAKALRDRGADKPPQVAELAPAEAQATQTAASVPEVPADKAPVASRPRAG